MASGIQLFHWEPNGSSLKTLLCLHEKGLSFESHYVDLVKFEQYEEAFLGMNPDGLVPVLIHDGRVLTESQFINEYLDEVFPETPLRPVPAEDLWRMRVWGKFTGEVLEPAACTLGCHFLLSPELQGRDLAAHLDRIPLVERRLAWRTAVEDDYGTGLMEDSRRQVGMAARQMEQRLSEHEWLAGNSYSLADIELFSWCNALEELVPDIFNSENTPRTVEWVERIRARPALAEALSHARTRAPQRAFAPGPEHSRWG